MTAAHWTADDGVALGGQSVDALANATPGYEDCARGMQPLPSRSRSLRSCSRAMDCLRRWLASSRRLRAVMPA